MLTLVMESGLSFGVKNTLYNSFKLTFRPVTRSCINPHSADLKKTWTQKALIK